MTLLWVLCAAERGCSTASRAFTQVLARGCSTMLLLSELDVCIRICCSNFTPIHSRRQRKPIIFPKGRITQRSAQVYLGSPYTTRAQWVMHPFVRSQQPHMVSLYQIFFDPTSFHIHHNPLASEPPSLMPSALPQGCHCGSASLKAQVCQHQCPPSELTECVCSLLLGKPISCGHGLW